MTKFTNSQLSTIISSLNTLMEEMNWPKHERKLKRIIDKAIKMMNGD